MNDLHVYARGVDPFELMLGDIRLVVHLGDPPPVGDDEDPGDQKPSVRRPTRLHPGYQSLRVVDLDDASLGDVLGTLETGTDLVLHVPGGAAPGGPVPGIDRVIADLDGSSAEDVSVHLLPDDPADG